MPIGNAIKDTLLSEKSRLLNYVYSLFPCMYRRVCVFACLSVCMYVVICLYTCIYLCVCMYVCMYIYVFFM